MKLAIVGSRSFTHFNTLESNILELIQEPINLIISGGAKGADTLAQDFAKSWNIPLKVFLPDWDKFGRAAGMMRNKDIVEACDCVIAFWDGISKGTANSIQHAKRLNKRLHIVLI